MKLILANSNLYKNFNSTSTIESSDDYLKVLHYHNSVVKDHISDWSQNLFEENMYVRSVITID